MEEIETIKKYMSYDQIKDKVDIEHYEEDQMVYVKFIPKGRLNKKATSLTRGKGFLTDGLKFSQYAFGLQSYHLIYARSVLINTAEVDLAKLILKEKLIDEELLDYTEVSIDSVNKTLIANIKFKVRFTKFSFTSDDINEIDGSVRFEGISDLVDQPLFECTFTLLKIDDYQEVEYEKVFKEFIKENKGKIKEKISMVRRLMSI